MPSSSTEVQQIVGGTIRLNLNPLVRIALPIDDPDVWGRVLPLSASSAD
jgi:hypothetical protein